MTENNRNYNTIKVEAAATVAELRGGPRICYTKSINGFVTFQVPHRDYVYEITKLLTEKELKTSRFVVKDQDDGEKETP